MLLNDPGCVKNSVSTLRTTQGGHEGPIRL